jgi:hypothetical protein
MAKPIVVDELWIGRIIGSVNGLEYGTVQIIVHDGRIVQIERTDRKRFDPEQGEVQKIKSPARPRNANT